MDGKDGKGWERMDGFPCLCCTQSTGITTKEIIPAGLTHCRSSARAALRATPGIKNSIIPCSWGLECWVEGWHSCCTCLVAAERGDLSGALHPLTKNPCAAGRHIPALGAAYPSPSSVTGKGINHGMLFPSSWTLFQHVQAAAPGFS